MTRKLRSSVRSQPGSRAALLAGAVREQRRELKELSSQARERQQTDRQALRRSLREAARDPLARQLGDLMEGQRGMTTCLKALQLPDPDRWYLSGKVFYGQLDTQLLRVVQDPDDGSLSLLRLTSAGEVRVTGVRELVMAEPSPLRGLQEVPQALVNLSLGRTNRVLSTVAVLCVAVFIFSSVGGAFFLLVLVWALGLKAIPAVLLLILISMGASVVADRWGSPQGRADWLVRRARARGVQLD